MKKRSVALLLLLCTVVSVLAGCSAKIYNYDSYGEYIKLGNYKGVTINQSDINNEIEDQWHSDLSADTTAKKDVKDVEYKTPNTDVLIQRGDVVTIDYVGKVDGVAFEGGTASDQELEIGSGEFIDGFEDGLIGFTVGDEVVLNLKFPDDYSKESLAGKDAVFTVTIDSFERTEYPELTDDNVKKYFSESKKFNTVKEYEDSIKEDIIRGLIWEELFEICKIKKYPEKELTQYYENYVDQYTQLAYAYGGTTDTFYSIFGYSSAKAFYQAMATNAKSNVKQELIILAILEAEPSLVLSDEDYEAALKELYEEQVDAGNFTEDYKHFKKHNDAMSLKISVYYKEISEYIEKNMTTFDDITKNGFYTNRYGTQYYINGEFQKGWTEIENDKGEKELYYFNEETGYSPELCAFMKHKDAEEEKWHQFDAKGKYIGLYNKSYIDKEGTRYFIDGVLQTGWQEGLNLDGKDDTDDKYYFDPTDGYMHVGYQKVEEEGVWHEFDKDGIWKGLAKDGLQVDINGGTLYFKDAVLQTGLFELDTDEDGTNEGYYYFDEKTGGYMVVKDVAECEEGVWYYFNDKGIRQNKADGIIKNDTGKRYFVDGVLQTGEKTVTENEKTNAYYFDPENDGYALISEWLMVKDTEDETKEVKKFYYNANGYKVVGQDLAIDGVTYTFDANGGWKVKESK